LLSSNNESIAAFERKLVFGALLKYQPSYGDARNCPGPITRAPGFTRRRSRAGAGSEGFALDSGSLA
jgi:hypothetical protein